MKNVFKKILATVLAVACIGTVAACGDKTPEGFTRVTFSYGVDGDVMIGEINKVVKAFNESETAKTNKIFVKTNPKSSSGFDSFLSTNLMSRDGSDVVTLEDEWYRPLTDKLEPLGETATANAGKLYASVADRLIYNPSTGLTDEDAKRYALPFYNNSVVTYVNVTKLKEANIKYISVDDTDEAIAAFNAGGADRNGKTKADLGITGTVLRKGFQRENPYAGRNWSKPGANELMIFNDRIAMNWDETEDLGRIMCTITNTNSPTDYGFYTEWWFSYGWSVGGDCIVDVTGDLDYKFSLPDSTANYIVTSGTFTGPKTGKTYAVGDTLEFIDKIAIGEGEKVTAESDGRFTIGGVTVSASDEVKQAVKDGVLAELPSMKTAFTRFAKLASNDKEYSGTRISPFPTEVKANKSTTGYFISGKLAMTIERVSNLDQVAELMRQSNQEWTIAPVPAYKEYEDPSNGSSDAVKVRGKQINHSHLLSVGIRKNTDVKEQSEIFLNWLVTEGQKILATDGFGTVNSDYETEVLAATNRVKNTSVFLGSSRNSKKGDWAYLTDRLWIDGWANPLNNEVRNGSQTLQNWFVSYVDSTNTQLAGYKKINK